MDDTERAVAELRRQNVRDLQPDVDEQAIDGVNFSECLPQALTMAMLQHRLRDLAGTAEVLRQPFRVVSSAGDEP